MAMTPLQDNRTAHVLTHNQHSHPPPRHRRWYPYRLHSHTKISLCTPIAVVEPCWSDRSDFPAKPPKPLTGCKVYHRVLPDPPRTKTTPHQGICMHMCTQVLESPKINRKHAPPSCPTAQPRRAQSAKAINNFMSTRYKSHNV